MSKKITHKEHRQLLSELYKKQGGKWIYQADAYIKQQEKQEKLLELYKRLNKVQTLLSWYKIHTINSDKIEKYEREVFDITKQIKELENE